VLFGSLDHPTRGTSAREEAMDKILIATDGSAAAQEAVLVGVALAREEDASVVFVHVLPDTSPYPVNSYGFVGAIPYELRDDDRQPLDEAEAVAEREGVRSTTRLLTGNVVDEIVAYADNLDVDLIVVGSRGLGALTSMLLGSISRGVLSESKRPVMVVRTKTPVAA
jgi:nucleotide-binding universal stress UspA family protein